MISNMHDNVGIQTPAIDTTIVYSPVAGVVQSNDFNVMGNASFSGEVTIKGRRLTEVIDKIESRLGILAPNEQLESRWDELKAIRQRYNELEAELLEKEKVWATLRS